MRNNERGHVGLKVWNYVHDYSRHHNLNEYLANIIGNNFREYRRKWKDASCLKREFDFPLFLVFETMFRCNLKCIMCIHSSPNKQRYAYNKKLPLYIFRKIMKESSSYYCPSLTFGGSSEPLLDANLIDMINIARENGFIDIMLNTNATLLTPEISHRLIKTGLTRLRIGFDGLTAKTYEKIRVGASFERVRDNIIRFIEIRDKTGSLLPVVRISCVNLFDNERELKGFIKFWKPIVDYVSIQMYRPHEFTKEYLQIGPLTKVVTNNLVCSQPFERLYIRGNGDIYACCHMIFGPQVGNVVNSSIYDIWNSSKMRTLRRCLKHHEWEKIPACKGCLGIEHR